MPVRVIGMIGVTPPASGATVHIIKGGISAPYLKSYAQAHDEAGFDLTLVGYTASSAEGFLMAQYAAQHTRRLGYLIAHRPGFVAPTLASAASCFATRWACQARAAVEVALSLWPARGWVAAKPFA